MKLPELDLLIDGYIEAMRVTDGGPDHPVFDCAALSREAIVVARTDCSRFFHRAKSLLDRAVRRPGFTWKAAGIDFWLTRNGHGSGFWDETVLQSDGLGRELSYFAKEMKESEAYLGHDGRIYLTQPVVLVPVGLL